MVATQNGDSVLEAHFESYKQSDSLYTVVAAIDVITHEEVVCVWRLTSNFEKLTQVMELTVNITTYGDWRTHLLHVWLIDQDFFCLNVKKNGVQQSAIIKFE